ncbi:DUF4402 domain-containing protein [Altererythrobacter sp. CAU 1778]
MKKILVLAAGAAAIVSAPAFAAPGDTATAQGSATATVVAPITLTHDTGAELGFGTFTTGTTGGSVVVTQAGVGTSTGDVTHMSTSTETADAFTATGDADRGFTISTTGGSVTLNGDGTTSPMAFTTSAPASGVLTGGTAGFTVGGTLTVPGNHPAGVYSGSYDATVTYN